MELTKSNVLEGTWNKIRGKVQQQWGELTDDDVDKIQGKYDELVGALQERYGYSEQRAREEVDTFLRNV